MGSRLLDALSRAVARHRGALLASVGAAALVAGLGLLRLEADASPEALAADIESERWARAELKEHFGDTDHAIVVLLEARGDRQDVLGRDALDWEHQTARYFGDEPWVARVDALTTTPLAVPPAAPAESGEPDGATTLDELEEEDDDAPEPPERVVDALGALVEAEPQRFPLGVGSIAETLADVDHGPPVAGNHPTDAEVARLRDALDREGELVVGRLVSRDRKLTAVVVWLADEVDDHARVTEAVRAVDARLAARPPPRGVRAVAGGLPHLRASIVDHMARDQGVLVPLTLVVCMLLLFASFRWWPGVVFPIVAVAVSALLVVGGMGLVGERLNILNNIIPPLLIIIGVSDSIHLIGRYREELRESGATILGATSDTVRAMAVACLLTSATTAVGLASLAVSDTPLLRRFGVTAAIGVMIAYVVTIAFLPPVLSFFAPPPQRAAQGGERLERLVVTLTRRVIRRPWPVIGAGAVLLGLALYATTLVEVDTSLLDSFEEGDPVFDTTRLLEAKLDGIRPLEVILHAEGATTFDDPDLLAGVDRVTRWLEAQPGVLRATSGSDFLHELWFLITGDPDERTTRFRTSSQVRGLATLLAERDPDPLRFFVSEDRRTARIEVKMADVGARAIMDVCEDLDVQLAHAFAHRRVVTGLTGDAFTGSVGLVSVVDDLLDSLGLAVLVIFGLLAVLFRSLRLGLLSIPPNGLPLVCTVGWMVLRGIPLNIATAIIFSISIGLAVDGTIHVLARFQEERRRGRDVDAALLAAAGGTGRAIVVSSLTLMLGFGVLFFSSFVPVRYFGELIAVTVASCLLATLILQPALLKVGAPRD